MTDIWNYLKTVTKPIVLYGTGNGADKIVNRLNQENIPLSGVFSSSGFKKGKIYFGFPVLSYEELKNKFSDLIILVAFGSNKKDVLDNINNLMLEQELYIPDVPVYGDNIFDITFAKNHSKEIEKAYSLLSDEKSKKVYENIIKYKLTGNPYLLFESESDLSENYSILNLNENEIYFDLGAYNGDTVLQFINEVKNYKQIIAVEPDEKNYKKLCLNTEKNENIIKINAAVSDSCGITQISKQHGRGVNTQGKKINIETITIDSIAEKYPPTFIKMDVEGCEDLTIEGGKKTISALKPKLLISCYHTSYDIFSIPIKINKLNPQYKIFLRHQKCIPAWDTDYIFI